MGILYQEIEIGDPSGTRFHTLEAMVDTGASYTVVPSSVLTDLGIQPHRRMMFKKPNGAQAQRDVSQTVVRVQGKQGMNMVVFGEEDDSVVLGANTLSGLGLEVDSEGNRLVPAVGLLVGIRLVDE